MEIDILLKKQNIVNDVAVELNQFARTLELSSSSEDKNAANIKELANYIRTPDDNETKPIVARAMQEGWALVKETCQRYNAFGRKSDDDRLEAIVVKSEEEYVIPGSVFDVTPGVARIDFNLGKAIDILANTTYHIILDMRGLTNSPGLFNLMVGNHIIGQVDLKAGMSPVSFDFINDAVEEGAFFVLRKLDLYAPDPTVQESSRNTLSYSYNIYDNYNLQLVMPSNFNVSVTSSITSHAHRLIVDTIVAAVLKNQQQEGYAKYLATAEKARQDLLRSLQARNSFGRVQHDWM